MPNLPTSLLLAVLAIAWIWVLVPMVARSREVVPETDDGAAGFRVLRRGGRSGMRLRRRASAATDDDGGDDMAEDLEAELDTARPGRRPGAHPARANVADDESLVDDLVDEDDEFEEFDEADEFDHRADLDGARQQVRAGRPLVGSGRTTASFDPGRDGLDAADEWVAEHPTSPRRPAGRGAPDRGAPDLGAEVRPVHRPGRGGFDAEHAAATAAYRYRRRRIVALTLLLITGGLAAAAQYTGRSALWLGVIGAGVVLVGYLFYLNRQVRIERAIIERRMARMRRAREIRPAMAPIAEPGSGYRDDGQQARPARRSSVRPASHGPRDEAELPPVVRGRSHLPPTMRRGYQVVDLDDDDPAFDDLERYEPPVVYRRAAGQ